MLDSPPTYHKHNCLMGYKHVCNTGGPRFDSTLKRFFIYVGKFFKLSKIATFRFLTCYRDACGYIKKVLIVDNAINVL